MTRVRTRTEGCGIVSMVVYLVYIRRTERRSLRTGEKNITRFVTLSMRDTLGIKDS